MFICIIIIIWHILAQTIFGQVGHWYAGRRSNILPPWHCPNQETFNVPRSSHYSTPWWFELSKRGKSFKTPCSNPVSVKWTFDQSQLKSFCILQLSGDPFKSAKSRPASGLSPIQTRPKSFLKNVNIFCFKK